MPSSRAGRSTAGPAWAGSRSACIRTSRAADRPEAGTRMSRRPAASMSGTSKPAERRVIDGIPSSSRMPCTISASAWCWALTTRTSSPSVNCGLILRARAWASVTGSSTPVRPAETSGIPQAGQKRSSSACVEAQLGQTSGSVTGHLDLDVDLAHDAVVDPIRAHRRLAVAAQADDQPLDPGPARGEVDVGLRRIGLRARVRVVDGAELGALGLEDVLGLDDLAPVHLEAQRARGDVGRLVDRDRVVLAHGDHPAAFVGEVAPRVREDALEERGFDAHYSVFRAGRSSSSSRSDSPLSDSLNSRIPFPMERPTSGSFFGPRTIRAMARMTTSSSGPTLGMSPAYRAGAPGTTPRYQRAVGRGLPPDGGVQVLDLFDGARVDAAGEVLPAVVADDEDDVALVHLVGDPHRDRRDRAARDAGEDALLVEQLARPHHGVVVGHEDLAVQQRQVDDRRDEAVVEGAQPLDRLALHGLGGDDLDAVAELLLEAPAVAHQRPARAQAGDEGVDLPVELVEDLRRGAVVVRERVGLVAVLVGHVVRGVGLGHLEGHGHRAVRALVARRVDDLRAVHLQQLGALG